MIEFTLFTSQTPLCKVISLNEDGNLIKKAGASLHDGEAARIAVGSLCDFWRSVKGCRPPKRWPTAFMPGRPNAR